MKKHLKENSMNSTHSISGKAPLSKDILRVTVALESHGKKPIVAIIYREDVYPSDMTSETLILAAADAIDSWVGISKHMLFTWNGDTVTASWKTSKKRKGTSPRTFPIKNSSKSTKKS